MTGVGWLPAPAEELFGPQAAAGESYEVLTVDVPPTVWTEALRVARDDLGCTYFDWLSAVDEPGTGLCVSAHVVVLSPVRRLLLRTTVPHEAPVLPSAVAVYAGAAWHERETHEMFGVIFEGHPALEHLLLPESFEGHPLRKDFVLAARVAKAWPGAKEPGESDHGGPKRRQMLPPGVPDPNEWGPLKGQLPPVPARPARAAGRTAGQRPVRRTRTAGEGSASQTPAEGATTETTPGTPRRARSASEGSASQRRAAAGAGSPAPAGPRGARSASEGAPSQRADTSAPEGAAPAPRTAPSSSDAPWHHARPAFDESEPSPGRGPETETADETADETGAQPGAVGREAGPGDAVGAGVAADSGESVGPGDAAGPGEATSPEEDRNLGEAHPGAEPPRSAPPDAPRPRDEAATPDDPTGGTQ